MEAAKVAKVGRSFDKFCIKNADLCKPLFIPAICTLLFCVFGVITTILLILSELLP